MSVRTEQDFALGHNLDMKHVEAEDKTIIHNLLQALSKGGPISYAFKLFPSIIYLTISNLNIVSLSLLEQLHLTSDRVKDITIDALSKTIIIRIQKARCPSKITIKKREKYNRNDIQAFSNGFIKEHSIIRNEDARLLTAIVTLFYTWTWKSVACDIDIAREGDRYDCSISNLLSLTYKQLQKLSSLGSWIDDIKFNFNNQSVLTFNVSRTETINNSPTYKRVKYH